MADLVLTSPAYSPALYGQGLSGGMGQAPNPFQSSVPGAWTVNVKHKFDATNIPGNYLFIAGQGFAQILVAGNKAEMLFYFGQNYSMDIRSRDTNLNLLPGYVNVWDGNEHEYEIAADANGLYVFIDGYCQGFQAQSLASTSPVYTNGFRVRADNYGLVDECAIFNNAQHTVTSSSQVGTTTQIYTPGKTNSTNANLLNYWPLDGNGSDVAGQSTTVVIAPTLANHIWSTSGNTDYNATTKVLNMCTPGAYIKTSVAGAAAQLNFDVSNLVTPYPQISIIVDGVTTVDVEVAAQVNVPIPSTTTAFPYHTLEVIYKSCLNSQTIFGSAGAIGQTVLQFQGIVLTAGGTLKDPAIKPYRIAMLDDSIGIGYGALAYNGGTVVDKQSSRLSFIRFIAAACNAEYYVIGYSGHGYSVPVSDVPVLPTSINSIRYGVSRSGVNIDVLLIENGTNDGSTDITSAVTSTLNSAFGGVFNISKGAIVFGPFNGTGLYSYMQAGIAASNNATRTKFVAGNNIVDYTNGVLDNVHPLAVEHKEHIAPAFTLPVVNMLLGSNLVAVVGPNTGVAKGVYNLSDIFNSTNCNRVYRVTSTGYQSWAPGSNSNAITQTITGASYLINMKQATDLSAYFGV